MALERKLNPPQTNNKLPAFIGKRQNEHNGSYQMAIPFNLNKAVGRADFNKMQLLVKTVQSNLTKITCITDMIYYDSKSHSYKAYFNLDPDEFIPMVG
jgi:hypothetical protein